MTHSWMGRTGATKDPWMNQGWNQGYCSRGDWFLWLITCSTHTIDMHNLSYMIFSTSLVDHGLLSMDADMLKISLKLLKDMLSGRMFICKNNQYTYARTRFERARFKAMVFEGDVMRPFCYYYYTVLLFIMSITVFRIIEFRRA
jgi:hypothetical protein